MTLSPPGTLPGAELGRIDLASYRRDGVVLARGLVPMTTLDRIAGEIADVFHRRAAAVGLNLAEGSDQASLSALLTGLFERDRASYIAAAKLTQHLASVHRLGVGDGLLGAIGKLGLAMPAFSTRPVIHYMADRLKIPGGYHKTPPHQDWRSVQGSVDGLTVWLPLFDVGPRDYPLEVIPGSHRRGLLPSTDDVFGHRVVDGAVQDSEFVKLPIARGDAAFFSGFLVHRTGDEGGAMVRIALSFRYNNAADPSFVARNYPDRYTYRPDMRLLEDEFSLSDELARIFPA
jgi:hypothetical protein